MRRLLVCVFVAGGLLPGAAWAAKGPPPLPKAASGTRSRSSRVGSDATAFAFLGSQTFVERFRGRGAPEDHRRRLPSQGRQGNEVRGRRRTFRARDVGLDAVCQRWSPDSRVGRLERHEVHDVEGDRDGPKRFSGFNGIIVVPGGKLYTGVSLSNGKKADYAHGTTPYANDVHSVDVETARSTSSRRDSVSRGSSRRCRGRKIRSCPTSARTT